MNIQRLVDVNRHKVIKTVPGTRSPVRVRPGGLGHQAKNSICVLLAVLRREGAPV